MDEQLPAHDPKVAVSGNLKRNVQETPELSASESEAKRIKESDAPIKEPTPVASTKEQREAERLAEKQRKLEEREQEKQRRLAERQAKKEARDREREAERARKEAQKEAEKREKEALKEAEKREKEAQKEAEKREKEAQKEAEKREKEAQKEAEKREKEALKEAEKTKKEAEKLKAQPSISKFFKTSQPPPGKPAVEPETATKLHQSDYEQHILPYQPRRDGTMFNVVCNATVSPNEPAMDPCTWLKTSSQRAAPAVTRLTCLEFQSQLARAHDSSQITSLLSKLRIRRIQFSHLNPKYGVEPSSIVPINVEHRPPYIGTTPDLPLADVEILQSDPFRTDRNPLLNYEYDSEVEWDGNDDGEDLEEDDMDDSDEDVEDADEMQAFLSADDEANTKRHKLVGPLTPTVVWDNAPGLQPFAMQMLQNQLVIDPLKVAEAPAPVAADPAPATIDPGTADPGAFLQSVCAKIPRTELHHALLQHDHSASTKTLIVELLKQKFPQALAAEIRQVFDTCFERVGKKRNEKKWVFTSAANQFFADSASPEPTAAGSPCVSKP